MQADLLESDPSCGMCYTRASNYYQNTGLTEPDHEEHFTDFDRLLCRLTIANCATLARRDLIARYYAEVRPGNIPNGLPTTLRCGSGSRPAAGSATSRSSRRCTAACRRA